jgi:hypothetical protein
LHRVRLTRVGFDRCRKLHDGPCHGDKHECDAVLVLKGGK